MNTKTFQHFQDIIANLWCRPLSSRSSHKFGSSKPRKDAYCG